MKKKILFSIVDTFISNCKQNNDSERQHVLHMLQSVGLPHKKVKTEFSFFFSLNILNIKILRMKWSTKKP